MYFDAGSVGLLCALALIVGYCIGLSHTRYFMGGIRIDASEVDRRTAPPRSRPPIEVDVE